MRAAARANRTRPHGSGMNDQRETVSPFIYPARCTIGIVIPAPGPRRPIPRHCAFRKSPGAESAPGQTLFRRRRGGRPPGRQIRRQIGLRLPAADHFSAVSPGTAGSSQTLIFIADPEARAGRTRTVRAGRLAKLFVRSPSPMYEQVSWIFLSISKWALFSTEINLPSDESF